MLHMKKTDVATMIGITSRQHIDFVLNDKRNFSYTTAKKAVLVFGGTLDVWMGEGNGKVRKKLWQEFVERVATK